MQRNFKEDVLDKITYLVGNADIVAGMPGVWAKEPFAEDILAFLNCISKRLLAKKMSRSYPDIVTFAFWVRKASGVKLKERFCREDRDFRLGKGVAFHIAPSNVPVNYAYSLAAGLMTGNANIVRLPSRDFPQVGIINQAILDALKEYPDFRPYICLVRYGRDQEVNDLLSGMADTRIIWGGDATIAEIRKSPLAPRAGEITFADRFSISVIDSGRYLEMQNKKTVADDFYNDTYLTDQNACTSPRVVVWTGNRKEEAKEIFWNNLHELVQTRYDVQPIQSINKLTSSYLLAATHPGVEIMEHEDNLLIRVEVPELTSDLMELKDNSGYFFEYDCEDILDLKDLCDDKRCQTLSYVGDVEMFMPLLKAGVNGIDRIVPIGKTMDFDLVWDGYNLYERLTRIVRIL